MSSCFLLIGKERLLKKEFIHDLQKKSFSSSSDALLNTQEWDACDQESLHKVLDFAQTAPFLAKTRIAVLWNIDELEKESRDKLTGAIVGLLPANTLVLISEETGTKKSSFLQALESVSVLVACHTPFDRDLPGWVETRAKKGGGTIEREASRGLIERAGKDASALQNSLEALFLYIHPRTSITLQDVVSFMGKSAAEDIFAIGADLTRKNTKDALEKIERLFSEGVRVPEIIGVLAGQLERMKQAADLMERGIPAAQIASIMRVPSFFQQKFFMEIKNASKSQIEKIQQRLLVCDVEFKEGKLGERLSLEKFILGL